MGQRWGLLFIILFGAFGCSVAPKERNELNARIRELEEQLERQRHIQEEMRVQQEALIAQLQATSRKTVLRKVEDKPESETVPILVEASVPMEDAAELSEQALYAKVLESYRAKSPDLLKRAVAIFVKNFAQSVYADNALFLNLRLAFERERWSDVQELSFDLESRYPFSNKIPAALLLRAQAEHQLGRDREAGRLLQEIQKQFPGSPEASQAYALEKRVGTAW